MKFEIENFLNSNGEQTDINLNINVQNQKFKVFFLINFLERLALKS